MRLHYGFFFAALLTVFSAGETLSAQAEMEPIVAQKRVNEALDSGDYVTAVRLLTPMANGGDAEASLLLGLLYMDGRGTKKNVPEALRLFRFAADSNDKQAQHIMGGLYLEGVAVPKSEATAAKYFLLAAEQEMPEAQFELAKLFDPGYFEGPAKVTIFIPDQKRDPSKVTRDAKIATQWYRRAADNGYSGAQYNLALSFENGEGVLQDYAEAARLYRLAAAQGLPQAQSNLSVLYHKGQGVPKSLIKSYAWALIAATSQHAGALVNLDAVTDKLTAKQKAQAQALAKQCIDSKFKDCD